MVSNNSQTVTRAELEADVANRERMLREIEASILELAGELRTKRERGETEADVATTINYMRSQLSRWSSIRYYLRQQRAVLRGGKQLPIREVSEQ